ncbi:zinc finger-containing ubiquitin peptidase 1-like isoform X2 [Cloeon dipterum]|uniref:zinc finger-containing ubiquitin peptidase 1-like isoform X2 n=1 Tax=Cloeon dipterum TaxID=197152 RepID=UPI00321FAFB8
MAASKLPDFSYSCEICGLEGLNDEQLRTHMLFQHVEGAVSCPFCDLGDISADELMVHVNSTHLEYLTPEHELMAFIDDDDQLQYSTASAASPELELEDGAAEPYYNTLQRYLEKAKVHEDKEDLPKENGSKWGWDQQLNNNLNNNNNNNVEEEAQAAAAPQHLVEKRQPQGSPLRSQMSLNLKQKSSPAKSAPVVEQLCPLCPYKNSNPLLLEEHINRAHFDLTSPSFPPADPTSHYNGGFAPLATFSGGATARQKDYHCPFCSRSFYDTPDLELHVNIEHKDILSPCKPASARSRVESGSSEGCPVCCMTGFKDHREMTRHIEEHFNQKAGVTPITPDMSSDRMLAREIEKREKEVRRQREQKEFEMLRAQYGMDNQGNFREQSMTNMQKAVYAGEMSVSDYYEKQCELKTAEQNGVDDGSSCTKDLVAKIRSFSASSTNVVSTFMCTTVDHYASTYGDKGWGCGYRNMQMLISSLLHHTGFNEQLYKPSLVGGGIYGMAVPSYDQANGGAHFGVEMVSRSTMPSISRLQQHIEWAWRQGFDLQGCDQLGGKLFNTRKWIGATEVVTFLSSLRIRCQLVDFHRPTAPDGSHPEMFNWALQYFQKNDEFKPPLYLQHQGHSRTVVGVEQSKDGSINMIVFDPSHTPQQMNQLHGTSTAASGMRLIRKSLAAMKARQYQVVAVMGIMDTEVLWFAQQSKLLRSIRVPQDR